jgi:DNA repair protein SbcC/Rad50
MKPCLLEFQAFGAYPDRQSIDFTALADNRLFLIHGATGAGKTTIFDAICYALYGEATARDRDGQSFLSHHAAPEIEPFVRLRFMLGNYEYEVERSVPFRKFNPAKKTFAKTETRRTILTDTTSGKTWTQNSANEELKRLLGMSAEQFRQVIVLPQGAFQTFLKASTAERRTILEGLFSTGLYARIEVMLAERLKMLDRQRHDLQTQIQHILGEQARSAEAIAGAITEAITETSAEASVEASVEAVFRADSSDAAGEHPFHHLAFHHLTFHNLDDFDTFTANLEYRSKRLQSLLPELRTAAEQAVKNRHTAEQHEKDVADYNDILHAQKQHQHLQPSVEAAQKEIAFAESAAWLAPTLDMLKSSEDQASKAQQRLQATQTALERAAASLQNARVASDDSVAHKPDAERLTEEMRALNDILPKLEQRTTLQMAKNLAAAATTQANEALLDAEKKLRACLADYDAAQAALPLLAEKAALLAAYTQDLERVTGIVRRREELENEREKWNTANAHEKIALVAESEAATRRAAQEAAFVATERRWRAQQAQRLAWDLQDDTPCPVCGSRSHPQPARELIEERLTEESLKKSNHALHLVTDRTYDDTKASMDEARSQHDTALAAFQTVKNEAAVIKERGKALSEELGSDAKASVDELQARITAAEARVREASTAATKRNALQKKIAELSVKKTERESTVQASKTALAGFQDAEREASLRLAAVEMPPALRLVAEEYGFRDEFVTISPDASTAPTSASAPLKNLTDRIQRCVQDIAAIEQAIQTSANALADAQNAHTSADTAQQAAHKEWQRLADTASTVRSRAETDAHSKGFDSLEAAQKAILSDSEREERTKRINGWQSRNLELNEQRKLLAARLQAATESVGSAMSVASTTSTASLAADLPMLRSKEQSAQQAVETCSLSLSRLDDVLRQSAERKHDAAGLMSAQTSLEAAYTLAHHLSTTASGTNTTVTSLKMKFQDYVLGALLEQVVEAANLRLGLISSGRYALERNTEHQGGNAAAMLNFLVVDYHTGRRRNASTLSGGETFFTSLALALGLADVVSLRSGGVRMDALFIDEGFGSLDAETLDVAVETLIQLQDGGRLVGVISHVDSLKERIGTRLEVVKTRKGSHINTWEGIAP